MDRIDLCLACDPYDVLNVQISLQRLSSLAHPIAFVRLETMQRKPVFMRIHSHRPHPHFGSSTHYPNSNFRTIGNKKRLNAAHG